MMGPSSHGCNLQLAALFFSLASAQIPGCARLCLCLSLLRVLIDASTRGADSVPLRFDSLT